MKIRSMQRAAAALACVGLLMPQGAIAAPVAPQQVAKKVVSQDVALRKGGVFVGQLVDAQGKALAGSEVALIHGKDIVVRTKTDKNGVFAAKGLRGGEYRVAAAGGQTNYRLWAPKTAPPAASNGALIVTGDAVVNGQYPAQGGGVVQFVKDHPMLIAAGVAAAIAIPLAVADDDDPSS